MFAIIKSGGRQYKVSVGQTLQVERLAVEDGTQIAIGEVLLIGDADNTTIGAPFIDNTQVLATVVGPTRGKKVIVFKYKSKKRYRHRRGHRQELTVLTIDDIVSNGKSLITGEAPKAKQQDEPTQDETAVTSTESTESAASSTPSRRRRTTQESETEE